MPKTIMIADETYDRLKRLKETKGISFTKLLNELSGKDDWESRKERLLALKGTWVSSAQDKEDEKWIKEGWKKWNKRYA